MESRSDKHEVEDDELVCKEEEGGRDTRTGVLKRSIEEVHARFG
jgi:hypothetical protein